MIWKIFLVGLVLQTTITNAIDEEEVESIFSKVDTKGGKREGDGVLDPKEVKKALSKLEMKLPRNKDKMLKLMEQAGAIDERITKQQFYKMVTEYYKEPHCTTESMRTGSYGNHIYHAHADWDGDWEDAENFCKSCGGHLASVHSEEEFEVIKDLSSTFWLGGLKGDDEMWKWTDGTDWDYENWDTEFASKNNYGIDSRVYVNPVWNHEWRGVPSYSWLFGFVCKYKMDLGEAEGSGEAEDSGAIDMYVIPPLAEGSGAIDMYV